MQSLLSKIDRHLIDAVDLISCEDRIFVNIAEHRQFFNYSFAERSGVAADEDIGLDTGSAKRCDGVL